MVAAFLAFAAVIPVRAQAPAQELAVAPVEAPSDATPLSADNEIYTLLGPAEAGDAQTQFALGNHYFDGRGVAQDYGQALAWYRKSADQNYAPALNQLGYINTRLAYRSITSVPCISTIWPQARAMREPSTTLEQCIRAAWGSNVILS